MTELVTGLALTKANGGVQVSLTVFAIVFPTLVAAVFFLVLWSRPYVFYPPSEFQTGVAAADYVRAMTNRPEVATANMEIGATSIRAEIEVIANEPDGPKQDDPGSWVAALFAKQYDDALKLLDERVASAKTNEGRIQSLSTIGFVKFEKSVQEGVEYFEGLLRDYPHEDQPYNLYGMSYVWRDLPVKGLQIADRGLTNAERKWRLWNLKSNCLVELGRVDDAIVAAEEGVTSAPSEPTNYLNLTRIFEKKQDVTSADSWFRRGIEGTAANEQILREYARFAADSNEPVEAARRYSQLVGRFPKSAEYHTLLGNAYLALELNDYAFEEYQQANELARGEEGWILANIGNILSNQGFPTEAGKYLKRALQKEPDSEYAYGRLVEAQKLARKEVERAAVLLAVPNEPS